MEGSLDPGPSDEEPYSADRPMLPQSLPDALDALDRDSALSRELGEVFVDYFLKLKRNEAGRFAQWLTDANAQDGERTHRLGAERVFRFLLNVDYTCGARRRALRSGVQRTDAMLERLNAAPARVDGSIDHYDWDELVQEDRVHRLIYTDPAIFHAEMTQIFGAVWVYLGHESQIPTQ